ncbi:MAG: aldo/keto reductase [Chlamydiota bacterium]
MELNRRSLATKEGTETFFAQHNIHPDKIRDLDGLQISALSVGTRLGPADDPTDQNYMDALVLCISHGINAIDTASHYRKQRSEKLLKSVFQKLRGLGVERDQLILSSKGGFIPESAESDSYEGYVRSRYVERGILRQNDVLQGCHSIAPKFLAEELEHSLENMGVECIDLYYIDGPELICRASGEEVFEERISAAFALLEEKVREGKIARYGIASWNGFRQKQGTKGLLHLERLCHLAESVGGEKHHFRAVQFPFNMVMLETLKTRNQPEEKSLVQVLEEQAIHATIASPLMQARVLSLPKHVFAGMPEELSPSLQALQFVTSWPWSSVVVGMRNEEHVHDNLKLLQRPNWSAEQMERVVGMLGI